MRLGGLELQIDLPLQVLIKEHRPPAPAAELGDRRGIGMLVKLGPLAPDPDRRVAAVEILIQRAEGGKAFEQIAFADGIFQKPERARRASAIFGQKGGEGELEGAELESGHAFVFDELGAAQDLDLRARGRVGVELAGAARALEILDRLHVQVEEITVEDAARKIGAGVERAAVVNGVQRVERNERSSGLPGRPVDERAQIGEIAAAPVAGRAYAIELNRDAGQAALAGRAGPGASGGKDQPRRRAPAADL